MNISRRWFIGGAASFGALEGCRLISGNAFSGGRPNLVFGVISDIHIIAENVDFGYQGNTRVLRHTLRWFDRQGVDGVMIVGDMADAGLISQLQCVADAWKAVFPGNRSVIDGRPVEKLFTSGNHDWEGFNYNYTVFGRPSKSLWNDQIPTIGMKRAWEEVFEEPYAPICRKTVKGYDFIGAHWDGAAGVRHGGGMPAMTDWFARNGQSLDPSRPFFYFQHPHPKDTCYGRWAWGNDGGRATKALSAFPNAVAFSGHSHYSLVDERTVWQGAFTSIGTGSLRYSGNPYDEFEDGYENMGRGDNKKARPDSEKFLEPLALANQRCGLLLRVYDDALTIERRDFVRDVDLGPDWTIPLPAAESKPFAFAARAKKSVAPQFPSAAAARATLGEAKARKAKTAEKVVNVVFNAASQTESSRVWRYEVQAEDLSGRKILSRNILSPDYSLPLGEASKEICLPVAVSKLPPDTGIRFRVTPFSCFGKAGAELVSNVIQIKGEKKNA